MCVALLVPMPRVSGKCMCWLGVMFAWLGAPGASLSSAERPDARGSAGSCCWAGCWIAGCACACVQGVNVVLLQACSALASRFERGGAHLLSRRRARRMAARGEEAACERRACCRCRDKHVLFACELSRAQLLEERLRAAHLERALGISLGTGGEASSARRKREAALADSWSVGSADTCVLCVRAVLLLACCRQAAAFCAASVPAKQATSWARATAARAARAATTRTTPSQIS